MTGEGGAAAPGAVRIRIAHGSRPPTGAAPAVGGAFVGFLLGSLAGIIFRPPIDTDEGTIVAYLAGGFIGAIVAALAVPRAKRLLGDRLRIRARTWAAAGFAALAAFIAGAVTGVLAQPITDAFLVAVGAGNELLPAVVASALLAVVASFLLVVLEETAIDRGGENPAPPRPGPRGPWPVIFTGALTGGVVGMLGGSLASAVTEATKGDLVGVEAGARGGMILAGWTGSLVGLLGTAVFIVIARLLRRAWGPRSGPA